MAPPYGLLFYWMGTGMFVMPLPSDQPPIDTAAHRRPEGLSMIHVERTTPSWTASIMCCRGPLSVYADDREPTASQMAAWQRQQRRWRLSWWRELLASMGWNRRRF